MAKLLRIEGKKGTKIYSGEYFTEQQARKAYLDKTGCLPSKTDAFGFDECDWFELKKFAQRGN